MKQIQSVRDRSSFGRIFDRAFSDRKVFIKCLDRNVEAGYCGYSKGLISLTSPLDIPFPLRTVIFTRSGDSLIFAHSSLCMSKGNRHCLNPSLIQIITSPRSGKREYIEHQNGRTAFATNILSYNEIISNIENRRDIIEGIRKRISSSSTSPFKYMKLYFAEENDTDPRMNYFQTASSPIHIRDIRTVFSDNTGSDTAYYLSQVHPYDQLLSSDRRYVSEISYPITFRGFFAYGYIQANDIHPIEADRIKLIAKLAEFIESAFQEHGIVKQLPDMIPLTDVSKLGIGISFPEISKTNHCKENTSAALEVILPKNRRIALSGSIKHIDILGNSRVNVGLQITRMNRSNRDVYDRFLRFMRIE